MITRLLIALLNAVVVFIILSVLVAILGLVGLGAVGSVIAPFILPIAVIVGILTFLGYIQNYWTRL